MVLALAAGLVLGGTSLNTIWVEAPPDVAPCTVEVFARVFRSRFGQVAVLPGERELATGEMQVVVRPGGQGLELRVRATGEPELVRELPGPGTDCLSASETAGLMVERYLDEIGAGIAAPPLVPLEAAASPTRWGVALEGAVTAELAVLPQMAPGESTGAIPALGIGGSLAIGVRRGSWQLSALGALEPAGTTLIAGSVAQGSLHLQAASLALAVSYLLAAGTGTVRFELGPGTELFWASTASPSGGQFGTIGSSFSLLPYIGVGVGYELPVWQDLSALAKASLRARLGSTQFEVTGEHADTVYTRQLDGEASLGLGYVFY
jgi:hypothetical protein